jgi:ArsR family transcriptional regulator, lead/cadmium/zinc/bismuth-responsive transcriptional repressor
MTLWKIVATCYALMRRALIDDREARKVANRARAFSDSTRLTLAAVLREGEELCVCDLSWISGASKPSSHTT